VFILIATPLISIACSMALAESGKKTLLIGIAHHHHVGGDGIAEKDFGGFCEIEERRILA